MRLIAVAVLIAGLWSCGRRPPRPDPPPPPPSGGFAAPDPTPQPPKREAAPQPSALEAPPPAPAATVPEVNLATMVSELSANLHDVLFAYDQADLSPDAVAILHRNAGLLQNAFVRFPQLSAVVEGHCDERGSAEYNLGLGDRRARRTVDVLAELGVPESRVTTISYGREAPLCAEPAESCWRRNRRAHFVVRIPEDR